MPTVEEMNDSSASLPDERDDQIPDPETQRSRMENEKVEDESERVAADIEESGSGVKFMRADSGELGSDEPDNEDDGKEDNPLQPQSESEIEGTQEEDDFVSTSADDASDSENQNDQKVSSSASLLGENSSKDMKTKKKKKKEKKKKEKKGTKKKKKEKKKKGGKSKEEYSSNEDNHMQNESKDRSDDHDGSPAIEGTRITVKTYHGEYDEENQQLSAMMVSLRKAEKARVNPFIYNQHDYDSDNDGMWNIIDQDSTQNDNGDEKKKRKKDKKRRHKMEWESSIAADETTSVLVDPSENSFSEITFEDCKSPAPRSTASLFSTSSNYSDNRDKSTHSRSAHSTAHSTAHSRAASNYSFRSFKEDRNTSVLRSIKGEDPNDDSGSDDSKNPNAKKRKLREDLEAQARARVEQSNKDSESSELLSVIRKYTRRSIERISSVFDGFDVGSDFGSDDDEESKDDDDAKKNDKKEGNGEEEDGKSKPGRQKCLELRERTCSRKAYILIVSLLIFLFVVGNVVLIVYVAT